MKATKRVLSVCRVLRLVHACRRPSHPYGRIDYQDDTEAPTYIQKVPVRVSAENAAAWVTGRPEHEREWPECVGKCVHGECQLSWHRAPCCFVDVREEYRHDGDRVADGEDDIDRHEQYKPVEDGHEDREVYYGRPYGTNTTVTGTFKGELEGYWREKEMYCKN